MKRRIIFGLILISILFIVTGIYIIMRIETTTAALDNLIQLHQVEILREDLLLKVKRVQSNLILKNTRYARGIDIMIGDVKKMDESVNKCFSCHHTERVLQILDNLKNNIESYKDSLNNVLLMRANFKRMEIEEDNAYRIGENLISRIDSIIIFTETKLEQNTKETLQRVSNIKKVLFSIILVVPFGVSILIQLLIREFTKPINALLVATKELKDGNLDYRVEGLKYEFNELAKSFNNMSQALKEQMYRMQQIEQLKVCGELAAGFAHEIKNPLAGIKLSMEVLSDDPSMSSENKDILLKVISEIKRIELLLKELLSFARPPKPNFEETDINLILENALLFSLKNPAFKGSTNLKIEKNLRDVPKIMADPMQLQQVFMNLIINAFDEMPDGGTLSLNTFYNHQDESLEIEVSDTGKGIAEKDLDFIFQPFFTTKSKGTGLGLAITKKIIEQHSGSIMVRNNPDKGATFTVKLPIRIEKVEKHEE
jgi:signal transduction histidine kinase